MDGICRGGPVWRDSPGGPDRQRASCQRRQGAGIASHVHIDRGRLGCNRQRPQVEWCSATVERCGSASLRSFRAVAQSDPPAAWSAPEPLFNGKDLTGWEVDDPSKTYWSAENGELHNEKAARTSTPRASSTTSSCTSNTTARKAATAASICAAATRSRWNTNRPRRTTVPPHGFHLRIHRAGHRGACRARASGRATMSRWWAAPLLSFATASDHRPRSRSPASPAARSTAAKANPARIYLQGDHTGGLRYRNITISIPSASSVRQLSYPNGLRRHLAIRVTRKHKDGVTVACALRPDCVNSQGVLHGGVFASIANEAAWHAMVHAYQVSATRPRANSRSTIFVLSPCPR